MAMEAYKEHTRTGKLGLINNAVTMAALSIKTTPEESDLLLSRLNNYGVMLERRYR